MIPERKKSVLCDCGEFDLPRHERSVCEAVREYYEVHPVFDD